MSFVQDRFKLEDGQLELTPEGYIVADVRISRTGIQEYYAWELGLESDEIDPDRKLKIYRPDAEVFKEESLASFASKPVTINHPWKPVTAEDVREIGVGWTGERVYRDGDHAKTRIVIVDAAAVNRVQRGDREVSSGYDAELDMTPGTTPAGEPYDAMMTNIMGNHIALVDAGRCGPTCRVGDCNGNASCTCGNGGKDMPNDIKTKTVVVDGISIETTEQGAQVIEKLDRAIKDAQAKVSQLEADAGKAATTHQAAIEAKDNEIAELKGRIPEGDSLDQLVEQRSTVIGIAKRVLGDAEIKGTNAEIKARVVAAKLGDAVVKGKSVEFIDASFDTIVTLMGDDDGDSGDGDHTPVDPIADAIRTRDTNAGKSTARQRYLDQLNGKQQEAN